MKVNPGTRLGKGFVDFLKKSTNPSGNKASNAVRINGLKKQ
jgi:hypothetical protein